jgi:putative phosphoesterase
MRLAVVSDIHGNLTALEAVIADLKQTVPDRVFQGGDVALSGSRPAEVVDRIRELGWPGVVGNTDEMLWVPERRLELQSRAPKLRNLFQVLFEEIAPATRALLGEGRIAWLRALPAQWHAEDFALVHASPQSLWRAPLKSGTDDEFAAAYSGLAAPTVVYGHIHTPFARSLPAMTVANSGSVSLSYDGDPHASYLLLEDGRVTIRRVEYDIEREVRGLKDSNYPLADWLGEILRLGKYVPPPDAPPWSRARA